MHMSAFEKHNTTSFIMGQLALPAALHDASVVLKHAIVVPNLTKSVTLVITV
jgi:hypothetical protein